MGFARGFQLRQPPDMRLMMRNATNKEALQWLDTVSQATVWRPCGFTPRRRSHWDNVRATLRPGLRRQDLKGQHVHSAFSIKLRVAMLAVRSKMSRQEASDALNGAGLLYQLRRASGLLQMFGRTRPAESSTSWWGRCLPCLPDPPSSALPPPRPRGRSPSVELVRKVQQKGKAKPLPAGVERFCSRWCPVEDENYDAYLVEIGLNWSLRMLAASLRPQPTYTIEDGVLHGRTEGVGLAA